MTGIDTPPGRKPRLALMGEFSAGKSTLANLLLGRDSSPVQVTATQLPPVWYRHGDPATRRVDLDGEIHPIGRSELSEVSPADTRMIEIFDRLDFLDTCDLIDMPGTSDPNMAMDNWLTLLPEVDCVIWCSPATQAWRQSEAALWEEVPPALHERSLLLVTRIDKMRSERDGARVVQRVRRETDGVFRAVLPIDLLSALEGREDAAQLRKSGAAALLENLAEVLRGLGAASDALLPPAVEEADVVPLRPGAVVADAATDAPDTPDAPSDDRARIVPRRVVRAAGGPARPASG